jgi:subtilisin family serine protease
MNNFTIFADRKALGTFAASFREANDVARRLKKELPQTSVVLCRAQEAVNVVVTGNQRHRVLLANAKKLVAAAATNPWNLLHSLDQAVEDADWYYEYSDCGSTYRRGLASVEHATRLYREALAFGGEIAAEAESIWKAATAQEEAGVVALAIHSL